uniref:DNA helicase n=1 Tax=viral metagenome TaxID=1070528 RepID=A0A6C0LRQ2_9ZZZZ
MDPYEESKLKTKRYKKLKSLLKIIYDYDNFRPKQYEIINRIICGEDVCAILPTSHGKSICFQIPALYMDKPAIILSPLISLMDDQQAILSDLGISSCCFNSTVYNKSLMKKNILNYKYKFIYFTPESIINMSDFLVELYKKIGISLIAIDEAHCISNYGFDFRKSYRGLQFLKKILPNTPILAVTATATELVSKDICDTLNLNTSIPPIQISFDRPNLYLEVRKKGNQFGIDIVSIVEKYKDEFMIIYCLTKKETSKIADILKMHKIKCGIYHAGLDLDERTETHTNFINGSIKIIVATIAFGMGINKPDVRVIIHYGSPKNIEGYYQEIGRAGRDGKKSYCYVFYNYRDFKIQESFIENITDTIFRKNQLKLLERIKGFMETKKCRRKFLLNYFDEDYLDKCDMCDNCCGVINYENDNIITTVQDISVEAKKLIELIESIKNMNYGIGMYINILRGSKNKSISTSMKKSKYYGIGNHKSIAWWKEISNHLIKLKYLQQSTIKGRFMMQIITVTKQGLMWANKIDFKDLIEQDDIKLQPVKMINTV